METKTNNEVQGVALKGDALTISATGMRVVEQVPSVMTTDDRQFVGELISSGWMEKVELNDHQWRTKHDQLSILADRQFPTPHGKFHQTIREQHVFFQQTVYLARDFEMALCDLEEMKRDLVDAEKSQDGRADLRVRRLKVQIASKEYDLRTMRHQMRFRVKELRGWKRIQDELMPEILKTYSEDEAWNREAGEPEEMFFRFLNMYTAIKRSNDAGEVHNLTALAEFAVDLAHRYEKLTEWAQSCTRDQLQVLVDIGAAKVDEKTGHILLRSKKPAPRIITEEK